MSKIVSMQIRMHVIMWLWVEVHVVWRLLCLTEVISIMKINNEHRLCQCA